MDEGKRHHPYGRGILDNQRLWLTPKELPPPSDHDLKEAEEGYLEIKLNFLLSLQDTDVIRNKLCRLNGWATGPPD